MIVNSHLPIIRFGVHLNIQKTLYMRTLFILIAGIFLITGKATAQTTTLKEVKITTSAQCDMCKKRIEDGLYSQKGVVEANLDVATKVVTIKFRSNKTNIENLKNYISSLGYTADDVPANKEAYDQLPGCCQIEGEHK